MRTFAERLLDCIEKSKTTQAELARKAAVSPASISDWVRDVTGPANVKAEPLLRAATFLNVHPVWLLTGKGPRHAGDVGILTAREPDAPYPAWPFSAIEQSALQSLRPDDLLRLEGAWILVAKQLGFDVRKQQAA